MIVKIVRKQKNIKVGEGFGKADTYKIVEAFNDDESASHRLREVVRRERVFQCDEVSVDALRVSESFCEKLTSRSQYGIIGSPKVDNSGTVKLYDIILHNRSLGSCFEFLCFDCDVFIMNDSGKTVEHYW